MSSRVIQSNETSVVTFDSAKVRNLALVVGVSLALMIPIFVFGIPSNHDLSNHFRFALPFYDAISNGHLYPGWLAESNRGYGDPSFRFYPPFLYYVLATARYSAGNWYAATQITYGLIAVVSGLGMYFWGRSTLPERSAVWVSVFYALAPYHINQLYQATLLAEWAASALLPFAFGFIERICKNRRRTDIAGLAFVYTLLILTHLPLTIIGSMALLVYALFRIKREDWLRTVFSLAVSCALGLCASAMYWVTMISELRWIGINEVERDPSVDYRHNFILSTISPDNLNVWWMNIVLLMTVLLSAPAFLLFTRGRSQALKSKSILMLTGFALFMTLPLSKPIWFLLTPLQQTQFPWRWLAIVSMGGCLLAASTLPLLGGSLHRAKRMLIIGAMVIAVAFTLSHMIREALYLTHRQFENTIAEVRGSASVNYWFPIWAHSNPRPMNVAVEAGTRSVSINEWEPEHRKFLLSPGSEHEARVRTFYYPNWTATSNGQQLVTRPDNDGALLISVPPGSTSVDLDFREPLRSRVSTYFSFAGFILIGSLALPINRRLNK